MYSKGSIKLFGPKTVSLVEKNCLFISLISFIYRLAYIVLITGMPDHTHTRMHAIVYKQQLVYEGKDLSGYVYPIIIKSQVRIPTYTQDVAPCILNV